MTEDRDEKVEKLQKNANLGQSEHRTLELFMCITGKSENYNQPELPPPRACTISGSLANFSHVNNAYSGRPCFCPVTKQPVGRTIYMVI